MEDIKKVIFDLTKNITKSSSGILKVTKLSMQLANEEQNLKSIYWDIGKKVHEIYCYGGTLGPFFDEKYLQIKEVEEKIICAKEALKEAKGSRPCPNCSKSIDKNAEFCPKCGYKVCGGEATSSLNNDNILPKQQFNESEYSNIHEGAEVTVSSNEIFSGKSIEKNKQESFTDEIIKEEKVQLNKKLCNICGSENDASEKFCLGCGRML